MDQTLPSFDMPPVIEVVMGVQFAPLQDFLAPHLGKFWNEVEQEYPKCSENPPIMPQVEDFERPGGLASRKFSIGTKPDLPRVFLVDESGHWLIQIQRDRFLHNWRMSTEKYPRFPEVRKRFFEQWSKFEQFIEVNVLGSIEINQLEITYLNRIPLASKKLPEVFPDFQWRDERRLLSSPESMEVSCTFRCEDTPKRLRATIQPSLHGEHHEMRFELTVRGGLKEGETLDDWYSDGREWIVKAFADLTSEQWHKKWSRTE